METVFKKLPRKYFDAVMDNVSDAVMLLSKDYRILWANKKLIDLTGLPRDKVLGSTCYKVTHNVDAPCSPPNDVCPIIELLAHNRSTSVVHKHFDNRGELHYVSVTVIPVRNFWGKVMHFIHIAREIAQSEGDLAK